MSKNIEVTDKQYEGISKVAESLGISPTELVLRGIKSCTLVLDLFPEQLPLEKTQSESKTTTAGAIL